MDLLSLPSLTTIVAVIGLITAYSIFRATHSGLKRHFPPGPKPLPFFGNMFDIPIYNAARTYVESESKYNSELFYIHFNVKITSSYHLLSRQNFVCKRIRRSEAALPLGRPRCDTNEGPRGDLPHAFVRQANSRLHKCAYSMYACVVGRCILRRRRSRGPTGTMMMR